MHFTVLKEILQFFSGNLKEELVIATFETEQIVKNKGN